jgi:CHAD domain-containing protein
MRPQAPIFLSVARPPIGLAAGQGFVGIRPYDTDNGDIAQANTPAMGRRVLAAHGFRTIMVGALDHLTSNIAPTLCGDAEGIHQLRIALRASRAALQLFAPRLDPVIVGQFDSDLKQLGRLFGTARDWDIFCLLTLPAAIADLDQERLTDLQHAAEAERCLSHNAVVTTLRSQHFAAMIISLAAWIGKVTAKGDMVDDPRLGALAPSLLDRVAAKVRKRDHRAGKLSAEARHSLRKALGNLCDDTKFLAALFPGRRLKRYQAICENLQALLGLANDADVAKRLVLSSIHDRSAEALLHWIKRRRRRSLKGLEAARDAFRAAPAFWHETEGGR